MADENKRAPEVDALLKQVFQDDLPPDAERKLRERFVLFRKNLQEPRRPTERTAKISGRLRGAVRREVWAFSSMLMIALGGLWHVSGRPQALTEVVSLVNGSLIISSRLREARSMECRLTYLSDEGVALQGTIRWTAPESIRVEVSDGERAIRSLRAAGSEVLVIDHVHHATRTYAGLEQLDDPAFAPFLDFLSPAFLDAAIYQEWEPIRSAVPDQARDEIYYYKIAAENAAAEMTVDRNSHLPLSIRKFSRPPRGASAPRDLRVEAHFRWNEANDSREGGR